MLGQDLCKVWQEKSKENNNNNNRAREDGFEARELGTVRGPDGGPRQLTPENLLSHDHHKPALLAQSKTGGIPLQLVAASRGNFVDEEPDGIGGGGGCRP